MVAFDADTIKPLMPTVQQDLPGGARRLVQSVHTDLTFEADDEKSGNRVSTLLLSGLDFAALTIP